jgi:DNA-binding transcriptional ArsR family regulator
MTPPETPTVDEVADVLRKRWRCLAALVSTPRAKRDLGEELDMPRSTLDRAIRELEGAGLVEAAGGGYRATAFGRVAHRVHGTYRSRLDDACAAAGVLSSLPPGTPLNDEFLAGASVSESSPFAPDSVVEALFESVAAADHVRGVAPTALTGHTSEFRESALAGGGRLTLVCAPELVETLERADAEEWHETLAHDRVETFEAEVPFGFGLWIVDDDEAGVVVYTETGIKAILRNDSEAAVAWAEAQYDRVADGATRLAPGADEGATAD